MEDESNNDIKIAKPGEQIMPNKPRSIAVNAAGDQTTSQLPDAPELPIASDDDSITPGETQSETEPIPASDETERPDTETPELDSAPEETPETEIPSEPQQPETPAPAATVQPDKKSSKLKKFLIGLIILALLGGLGYAGWKVTSQEPVTVTPVVTTKKNVDLLRVGSVEGLVNSFYPSADDFELSSFQVNNQIYEGLVKFEDVSKIVPGLATSWTNPDDSTWLFNLKKGVKFHDGNTMTAKDVKYSLEKYQDKAFEGAFGFDIKAITVVNDSQIKIETTAPDPLLLHKLAYLMVVDSKSTKDGDPTAATGPYEVKTGTTPTASTLDLVAFDQYHGGTPTTKEIKWTSYATEDELVKDTTGGKIDYAIAVDTLANIKELDAKTDFILTSDTGIGVSSMGLNLNKVGSPLQKLKFRQAIALAIDKQQVIDDANLKAVPAYQIVTKDVPGYNTDIKVVKPDLAAAKKLLTEAGYPNGASFSLAFSKEFATDQANSIAKQLKQINVTVNLAPQNDFDSLSEIAFSGKGDAYFMSETTDLLDASDAIVYLFQNKNYTNATVDTLLKDAGTTMDSDKRLKNLQDASKLIMDDVAEVPIYSRTDNTAYDPSLVVHRDSYIGPYFWQVYKKG